jgi:hypothetical protein
LPAVAKIAIEKCAIAIHCFNISNHTEFIREITEL